jgi:hypothetical protein
MLKIQGSHTQYVEFQVTESEVLEQAMLLVRKSVGLHTGHFLSANKLEVRYDDPHHRHGSISEYTLREATAADLEAFATIAYLSNLERSLSRKP